MIAAVYAAVTILVGQFLGMLSWGLVQFRVSEALTVVAFFTPAAIPGLTLGSVIANALHLRRDWQPARDCSTSSSGRSARCSARCGRGDSASRTALALAGPVICNALIVPAYLPLLLKASGCYTVPLLGLDVEGAGSPCTFSVWSRSESARLS